MSLSTTSKVNITLKKINGKAHTSNDKGLINEALPSGISLSSSTIFGDEIPAIPDSTSYYTITDSTVEYIRLPLTFIPGTDTSSGRHAFEASLPSDYETNSSNPYKGIYPFQNGQTLQSTKGKIQLIPTSFGDDYEANPFYDDGLITQIPVADARNWALDYFNGILFQEIPPGTGNDPENPVYIDAYLYIGNMLDTVIDNVSGGSGDGSAKIREKNIYQAGATVTAGTNIVLPGVDFSLSSLDPELIDIHVNGTLVANSNELVLADADYSIINIQTVQFSFDLDVGDIVTTATFNKSAIASVAYNEFPTGTQDGVNTVFTLSNTPVSGITLSFNGQILSPTTVTGVRDYIIAGSTINITAGIEVESDDILMATYSY